MPPTQDGGRHAVRAVIRTGSIPLLALAAALLLAPAHASAAPPLPPSASFTYEPESPFVGQEVTFTSTSTVSGANNQLTVHEWDLDGNGTYETNTGVARTTSNVYDAPGNVKVSLRVTDKRSLQAVTAHTITIVVATVNRPPVASFAYAPLAPVAGGNVSFFSTSTDADSAIASQEWDLDGDGNFGDATGPMAVHAFAQAGSYLVSLRVTDSANDSTIATQTVVVGNAGSSVRSRSSPRALRPFPVVRIAGTVTLAGTVLKRLSVTAPRRAKVTVRCKGKGCPLARWTRAASGPGARAARLLRVRRFERRALPAGVRIEVFVTRRGLIGKYTRFEMRRARGPARVDRCIIPGAKKPKRCPRI